MLLRVRRLAEVMSVGALLVLASCDAGDITDVKGQPPEEQTDPKQHVDVLVSIAHDVSPPLRDLVAGPVPEEERVRPFRVDQVRLIPRPPELYSPRLDPVIQPGMGIAAAPTVAASFDGLGDGFSGAGGTFTVDSAPPDTDGDVGPNHYVQIVNSSFVVFNKTGTALTPPRATNVLWSGFNSPCANTDDGDGVARYDRLADRWVIQQFSVSSSQTSFFQCVAVSTSGDPTGTYNRYAFQYNGFNDYPKMAVWPDAYYVTYNMFNAAGTSFVGGQICALDRAKMIAGAATVTQQCQNFGMNEGGILVSDVDGPTAPPSGSNAYALALDTSSTLHFWTLHVDFATPANTHFTGPTSITVASFTPLASAPQPSGGNSLDSLSDRLMNRLVYRNFGDHEALLVTHSVAGSGSTGGGIRWYEIRSPGTTPSVFQQGTFAPDSATRWMGSAAFDHNGNIALGYSISSSSINPSVRVTGRLATDALGTMTQGESTLVNGGGVQTGGNNLTRWGDYSSMNIDPSDDCTFWYTQEYIGANGAFNWKTRVGNFKLPGCGAAGNDFSIGVSPQSASVGAGSSTQVTVSTAVTAGSAQSINLSVSGLPTGVTGSFSPATITAGGSATLTLTAASTAPAVTADPYSVIGTAASGQHTAANTTVTVAAVADDFSISVSPSSRTVTAGGSTTYTVTTAVVSGSAQSISLSAAGLPAGATASFSPATVTAGGSSTLTVSTSSQTPAGSSTLTIRGTAASGTHAVSTGLTVNANAGTGLANGGFETGTLGGWTAVGATAAVGNDVHSGSFAAMVGSTNPFNGDSSISQSFQVPANGGTLSFWTHVHCTDTVTFDWATATLTQAGSTTAVTVLPKTCPSSDLGFVRTTFNLAMFAGKTVTLTLVAHDDDFDSPPDPTYAVFDDVTLTPAPPNPIVNPGFESGSLSGWTASGPVAVNTTAPGSGMFSAQVGSTAPTATDGVLKQTFTVPTGASMFLFAYNVHCSDTVTFDWLTVTLSDNTTGTTTTALGKTCTNNQGWKTSSGVAVTPGHSVTITVTVHDDDFDSPPDPTWAQLDDFRVQ
jgi:hypothetical protein